jgi:hypothetical protein
MNLAVRRRLLAMTLGLAWWPSLAAPPSSPLRTWLLGDWRSDRERTIENFYFQGQSLTPLQRERVSLLFGHLRYHVTRSHFHVVEGERTLYVPYTVASETGSSITLRFPRGGDMPDLTLYRVSSDALFIKVGKNLEYFRRNAT